MIDDYDFLGQNGLSLERLATLCRFVEQGGLTRAAAGDSTRLSQYSRQLKDLQEFFGVGLTRKVGRTVVPTEEAQALAGKVRGHLRDLREACRPARGPRPFTLGASHSFLEWHLPRLLPRLDKLLRDRRPLRWVALRGRDAVLRLEQRLLDCAVLREERVQPGMERRILGTVGYRLFVPAQMIGDRNLGTLLEKLPIAIAQGGRFRDAIELGSRESGLSWSPSLECSSHTLSAAAVATGTYAAILPSMARTAFAQASVKDFPLPATWRMEQNLALAWLPGGERLQMDLAEILVSGL